MIPGNIRIAIPKGRILMDVMPVLERAGINLQKDFGESRKLIQETEEGDLDFCFVRSRDVPLLVSRGYADVGIVGSDTLKEVDDSELDPFEDLGVSRCRLSVIGIQGTNLIERSSIVVATKYPRITESFFARYKVKTSIVKMHGAVEMAPILKLADVAVDIVDTGATLLSNDLIEIHHICSVSAQLITSNYLNDDLRRKVNRLVDRISRAKDMTTSDPLSILPSDQSAQRVLM